MRNSLVLDPSVIGVFCPQ